MKTNKRNNKRFRKTKKHRMVGGVPTLERGWVFDGAKRAWEEGAAEIYTLANEEFKVAYHKNDIYDNFVGRQIKHLEKGHFVRKGTLTFKNGDVYEGMLTNYNNRDLMDDTNGKMTYKNGIVYEGEWLQGKRHGKGKLIDKNGGVSYKGKWDAKPWEADKAIDILPEHYSVADVSYKQFGNKEVSYEEFKNFVEELGLQYDVLDKLGYQGRCKLIKDTHLTGNITGGKNKKSKRNKKYRKSCKYRRC